MSTEILKFLIPILLILSGIWAKYSSESWLKRNWWILVLIGVINLILKLIQIF
ncbi:hypothetical protein SAMN06296427_10479 [Moheibacter sediminis]|uniref:Uncharacterized protein n=1 Tax=Moheibacter sediminis TaxID=1434700 RepID=A0A1W2ADI5_9FLAO|nr:hypothetical protein SAMN06296427_10479 [Moheibacter sediminis]